MQNYLVLDCRLATNLTDIIVTLKYSGSQIISKIELTILIVLSMWNILTCLHSLQQSSIKLTDFYCNFIDWSNGTDILNNLFLCFSFVT